MKKKAALYLRLSREDEEKGRFSQSIENQRKFLLGCLEAYGMRLQGIYIDDGYTGTNFDRPGFREMIAAVERGEVDAVLVKDLSRLGRDHIDTGYYYERYFPARGVRFIAVSDGIDTERETAGNDMSLFQAAFNDLYAKDVSKKVIAALRAKKQNGEFIGAKPPYGFRRGSGGRLVPEPGEGETVRRIFSAFLAGETLSGIARRLTEEEIPPPSGKRLGARWNDTTVRRILKNPVCCGDLTQNRTRRISYKVPKRRALPEEEWITVRDTHEPVVERAVFEAAQEEFARRARGKAAEHLLGGLLFCADCGGRMTFLSRGGHSYAVCSAWKKGGACASHCCSEEALDDAVAAFLSRESGVTEPLPAEFIRAAVERAELTGEKGLVLHLNTGEEMKKP